jgi:microtubule-associated protein-like 5
MLNFWKILYIGWSVQGIWPPGSDMSDINSVDRHCGNKLLATADDFGLVKLFRFPCISKDSKFSAYQVIENGLFFY